MRRHKPDAGGLFRRAKLVPRASYMTYYLFVLSMMGDPWGGLGSLGCPCGGPWEVPGGLWEILGEPWGSPGIPGVPLGRRWVVPGGSLGVPGLP